MYRYFAATERNRRGGGSIEGQARSRGGWGNISAVPFSLMANTKERGRGFGPRPRSYFEYFMPFFIL